MKHPHEAVGRRLKAIEIATGLTGAELQRLTNGVIVNTRWSEYTKGKRLISVEAAKALRGLTGVTLDYIYMGDEAGLPARLLSLLHNSAA